MNAGENVPSIKGTPINPGDLTQGCTLQALSAPPPQWPLPLWARAPLQHWAAGTVSVCVSVSTTGPEIISGNTFISPSPRRVSDRKQEVFKSSQRLCFAEQQWNSVQSCSFCANLKLFENNFFKGGRGATSSNCAVRNHHNCLTCHIRRHELLESPALVFTTDDTRRPSFHTEQTWKGGFPGGSVVKNTPASAGRGPGFQPWVGKIPWRREVFLPGESHGERGAWRATVHGVAQTRARVSDWGLEHKLEKEWVTNIWDWNPRC